MLAGGAALGVVRAQQPQIATPQQTTTQQPAPPPGAVSGVVVDAVTQKPLAGAVVSMSGTPVNPPAPQPGAPPVPPGSVVRQFRQMTDERGRFIFADAPGGYRYTVSATKFGYFDGAYGRRGPAGVGGTTAARAIALADGQWFKDAKIELLPPSSITGRVFDEAGQPIVGAIVRAHVEVYVSGTRQVASSVSATTDDRGMYRLAGLNAGSYVISVPSAQHSVPAASFQIDPGFTPELPPAIAVDAANRLVILPMAPPSAPSAGGRPQIYPTTFYPNSRTLAEAANVAIKPAEDRTGVDMQLNPVLVVRVSGRLDGPADVIGGLSLRLMSAGTEGFGRGGESATALTTGDGAFTFLNVPSGSYTIVAARSISEYTQRSSLAPNINPPSVFGARFSSSSSNGVATATASASLSTYAMQGNVRYQGRAGITVAGRDLVDVVVPMTAGITISGRFEYELQAGAPALRGSPMGFGMAAEPANADPSLGVAREQRAPGPVDLNAPPPETFSVAGVMAGEFLLRSLGGAPGLIKSIVWNGRDYTYTPFDTTGGRDITGVVVTFTDQVTTAVTGTVKETNGQAAAGAAVIVFPAERAQWMKYGVQPTRLRAAAASTTGVFTVRPLPAGDYFIIAIDGDAIEQWKDPKWLERASALATKFSISWGGRVTQDLVVAQVR